MIHLKIIPVRIDATNYKIANKKDLGSELILRKIRKILRKISFWLVQSQIINI